MIHLRPPPKVESTDLPVLPQPAVYQDGARIGWPQVFVYEFTIEGATCRTQLPPPHMQPEVYSAIVRADPMKRGTMPTGQAPTWPYRIIVKPGQLAVYEAMVRAGMLRDPRHLGFEPTREIGALVDGRHA